MSPLRHSDPGLLRAIVRATSSLLALRQAGYRKAGGDGNRAKVAAEWRERTWFFVTRCSGARAVAGMLRRRGAARSCVRRGRPARRHVHPAAPVGLRSTRAAPRRAARALLLRAPRRATHGRRRSRWRDVVDHHEPLARGRVAMARLPAEPARPAGADRALAGPPARGSQPRRLSRGARRRRARLLARHPGAERCRGRAGGRFLASRRRDRSCHPRPPDERGVRRDAPVRSAPRAGTRGSHPRGTRRSRS